VFSAFPRRVRAAVSVLAVAAYALPPTLAALSVLSHSVSHLAEEAREQHRIANALGLTHPGSSQSEAGGDHSALYFFEAPSRTGTLVHSHGGVEHSHVGVVQALLVAADQSLDELSGAVAAPASLSAHVPPHASATWAVDFTIVSPNRSAALAIAPADIRPPVRPPRA